MYRKTLDSWLKHSDFIILDLLCLQLAFVLSYILRHGLSNPYAELLYRNMAIFLVIADMLVLLSNETFSRVLKRGYYKEFVATVRQGVFVALLAVLYLFIMKEGSSYSRLSLGIMCLLYMLIAYVVRISWKIFLRNSIFKERKRALLLITSYKNAATLITRVKNQGYAEYAIVGVIITDRDLTGTEIHGVSVVASEATVVDYISGEWIDEIFIDISDDMSYPQNLVDDITQMGVTVHLNLTKFAEIKGKKQFMGKIGDYTVITTSINYMTQKQAIAKRLLDIVGGLVGCVLTGIIFVFVAPMIYLASPGPIFFSQVRVGKNGKRFKIYKFRSMYMDAEERKAELMEQNRVKDGMMFKVDFDPRIIGNKRLPSGKQKTGIGHFIRKTSLDEFPQFYNVLKGDMSLVGTRPPTLDEWEKYELHHHARLATKPGITGMWQVSGRSCITDFEEVVKLDTKYINEWSMGLDLRILFKTVIAVLKREGSM